MVGTRGTKEVAKEARSPSTTMWEAVAPRKETSLAYISCEGEKGG